MSESVLPRLKDYVSGVFSQRARPFFLVVDRDYRVREWLGEGGYYGLPELRTGTAVGESLLFLQGTAERPDAYTVLETVETPAGTWADVHVVALKEGWGLAYVDVSRERHRQAKFQQAAHDLSLLSEQRERLLGELQKARAELEEANRVQSEFIGRMSHEFRTPLTSVLGFADLLSEDAADPAMVQHNVGAIRRGARYLLNLVDNLLDQARLESDALQIHPAVCDAQALGADLEEMFRPIAEQKGLSFVWIFDSSIPERLWLDELRLRQVLINLIGNAFKFTREGSVSVEIAWHDQRLSVEVVDTGPGIPEQALSRVFEAFHQETTTSGYAGGAGLGLAISRALVRQMGGELSIDSKLGSGTRLSFHCDAPPRQVAQRVDHGPLRDALVLVVDDDEDIRALLKVYLDGAGCRVMLASGRDEALRLVQGGKPELVLLDLQLGEIRGDRMAALLREVGYRGPLAMMSAADGASVREQVEHAGARAFLTKPLNRGELLNQLSELLSR